jgi:homoserine O-acetyltransferase/O-succinyltransferase
MARPISARIFRDERPLALEFGGRLAHLEVAYETWGRLSHSRDNAILICPAFSGHCHANSHEGDPAPGWWEGMVGPGLAFDTDEFFVICSSLLGASYGTTGPTSLDPATGKAYGASFPIVSVRDLVDVQVRLLEHLGIDKLVAAVGGSLGGMETIDLAIRWPDKVRKVASISATDRTRPYTAAIRHLGRRAIMLDPDFQAGFYEGPGPLQGLALAREIGTLFYRSREELNQRFKWQPVKPPSLDDITFDVQSYLRHQGNKILAEFDANSYLTLSLAMDLFDVWRGFPSREEALESVGAEFLIVGVDEDRLIPPDEQEWLHHALITAGKRSHWRRLSCHVGHDTFLVEKDLMTELLRAFIRP